MSFKEIKFKGHLPIDLVPLENFKVEINYPTTHNTLYMSIDLDGFLGDLSCNCLIEVLMEKGCQCGGI